MKLFGSNVHGDIISNTSFEGLWTIIQAIQDLVGEIAGINSNSLEIGKRNRKRVQCITANITYKSWLIRLRCLFDYIQKTIPNISHPQVFNNYTKELNSWYSQMRLTHCISTWLRLFWMCRKMKISKTWVQTKRCLSFCWNCMLLFLLLLSVRMYVCAIRVCLLLSLSIHKLLECKRQ